MLNFFKFFLFEKHHLKYTLLNIRLNEDSKKKFMQKTGLYVVCDIKQFILFDWKKLKYCEITEVIITLPIT